MDFPSSESAQEVQRVSEGRVRAWKHAKLDDVITGLTRENGMATVMTNG